MSANLDWDLPYEVGHHVYSAGTLDANNQAVPVYTPPLTQAGVSVAVFGWETPKSDEPHVTGHQSRVTRSTKLFVPPNFNPGAEDVIDVPGHGQWDVVGIAETADGNPFEWNPGSAIELRQVTG